MYIKHEEMERRCLPKTELRLEGEAEPKIVGYAAVFNTWTDIGGWFREMIKPGAFAKTIKENDIRALIDHKSELILGRNKAKPSPTLKLREDSTGLAVEIIPPNTSYANDLLISMRRGDLTQMSFGFLVNKQEVDYEKDERTLLDVTLFDVSVVTYPAYPTTSAEVRKAFQEKKRNDEQQNDQNKWVEIDAIIQKLKAGDELTENEKRTLASFIPDLSVPPAKHTETPAEPPAKHSDDDTRARIDAWTAFEVKHGIFK